MKRKTPLLPPTLVLILSSRAQQATLNRGQLKALTPDWKAERLTDESHRV
jgi:hypothetical protein